MSYPRITVLEYETLPERSTVCCGDLELTTARVHCKVGVMHTYSTVLEEVFYFKSWEAVLFLTRCYYCDALFRPKGGSYRLKYTDIPGNLIQR